MRRIFDGADPLFLELSEDRAFVYIVGEERFFGARALEERLAQAGIAASVFAGTVCRSPSDLALSYARALRDSAAKETEATAGAYPAELFHALIHALQFGEKERIPFTLMSISESLKGFSGTPEALEIAYEALHQAQLWLEGQSDAEAFEPFGSSRTGCLIRAPTCARRRRSRSNGSASCCSSASRTNRASKTRWSRKCWSFSREISATQI